ncbi:hypothetical protein PR202_gn00399 [Eleusine coracana subsp. coracana]|uniref:Protein kinase domain-containing protein n=1 Tax=Eleusine coracana subsp. coracana TaxID=191504 RepID=A0AAV5G2H1_ELECO|nr:hypothetical protein PR202_gn00399 [Eleusine coracana subsp. coracana]
MFDAEIASQKNMKILEGVAKLAGECLRMERHTRPEMIDVAERLRMLRKASDQGRRQRIGLFSWIRKNKPSDVCCHFSFADMKDATNNFEASLVVGEGAFGRVYQGTIRGRETKVVIKRRQSWDPYSELEFHRVIEMMSKLQHHHIVPLIGYCYEEDEMILVYDNMARGSLRDRLYNTQSPPLTWIQRLKICIGAARALQYLHESHIIHGNLKTVDILLDEEWTAKITDTGLSKTGSSSTDEATKSGFLDPEYVHTGQLTGKSDVYSFGAVLFEVICAPPVLDRVLQFEDILADWAARWKEEGNLRTIAGTYLKGKNNLRYLNKFTETAEKCLAYRGY